jgi:predicted DsbA family dithiol-disulfide isomerase
VRTDRLKKEYGFSFIWRAFPLHPEIPEEGVEIPELFAGRGYDIASAQERLRQVAREEGLPLGDRTRISNGRRAQELGKFAERSGLLEPYQKAVYHAYFVEGRNIARKDELLEIAARVGLPVPEAGRVLEEGSCVDAVEADWERSRELGITGVPAFVHKNKLLVGFRPYRVFLEFAGLKPNG